MSSTRPITTLGFDADDTLWHNETIFRLTQARFLDLLADHADGPTTQKQLAEIEGRNLRLYGYGIKGFTLSMIETAMELCGGEAPPHIVREILAAGRDMIGHPVEPLPDVAETLAELSKDYRLIVVTKGDLLDQERKLAASGLGDLFSVVEIVSEKDANTYQRVFDRHGTGPNQAVMIGNSVKSDILPALEAGAFAIHIPYAVTWAHEVAEVSRDHHRLGVCDIITEVPEIIRTLSEDRS